MPGGIGSVLDISRRALYAQTQSLRVISNNVSNVNTDGYSRRKVELTSRALSGNSDGNAFGTGVEVNRVIRIVDSFLQDELKSRISERASSEARGEFLSRAESVFSLDQTVGRIGYQLTEFFGSLEDLASNPGNIPLRSNVIDKGEALTESIQNTYNHIAELQREADSRVSIMVDEVNQLTAQIAELNGLLTQSDSSAQENLTLLDQRELLLQELSEKVGITTVTNNDGAVIVSLENGFGLVTGTQSRAIEYTPSASFTPLGGFPVGLDGQGLGHVVYDFDPTATTSHVDLTSVLASSGGEIGGLLSLRGVQSTTDTTSFDATGNLVDIATRVESIARDLLTRFNLSYLGPDENGAVAGHQASSGDLAGGTPGVYGLFTFGGAADSDSDGLPDDLTTIGLPNYSSILQFGVEDPSDLAAALDLDPAGGVTSFVEGDASNIYRITALRDDKVSYALGNFSQTATIEELYESSVTYIGGVSFRAQNDLAIDKDQEAQQLELQASVSGVNLDEEFAQLINYQRAFEASARLIRVGDEMLSKILGLVG